MLKPRLLQICVGILALTVAFLALMSSSFSPSGTAQSNGPAWPMYGHDVKHSSRSEYLGPQILTSPTITDVLPGASIISPTVIGSGDVVYVPVFISNSVGRVYAFDAAGQPIQGWPFDPQDGRTIRFSPAVGPDGTIYLPFSGTNGGALYALNPDGSLKWPSPFLSSQQSSVDQLVVGADGTIYFVGERLYAINPNGNLRWSSYGSYPTLATDGTIYVVGGPTITPNNGLSALNSDGTVRWAHIYNAQTILQSLVVGNDGTLYVVQRDVNSLDTYLDALDPQTGNVLHQRLVGFSFNLGSLLAVTPNGTIVSVGDVGGQESHLLGLSPDLSSAVFDISLAPNATRTFPAMGADGTIYLPLDSNGPDFPARVVAYGQDGTFKSDFPVGTALLTSGAISSTGRLYFGSFGGSNEAGRLYAFAGPPQPTPTSTPTPNIPPTAGFTMTYGAQSMTEGQTLNINAPIGPVQVNFSANRSSDPDGTVSGWQWVIDGVNASNASSVTYGLSIGNHTVVLTVTDNQGAISQAALGVVDITLPPPPIIRTAPFDFFNGCNDKQEITGGGLFSLASAIVLSDPLRGSVNLNIQAAGILANAFGRAGVGVNYVSEFTGSVKIRAVVSIGPGYDLINATVLPKIGNAGIASIKSDVFITAAPPLDAKTTYRFRDAIVAPLPSINPIPKPVEFELHNYNPPEKYAVEHVAQVSKGGQLRICAGVQSDAVTTAFPGVFASSKASYSARILEIRITPQ